MFKGQGIKQLKEIKLPLRNKTEIHKGRKRRTTVFHIKI